MISTIQTINEVQVQTYTLSQDTIISCKILAMGLQELSDYVHEAILENPMIELETHAVSANRPVGMDMSGMPSSAAGKDADTNRGFEISCDIYGKTPSSNNKLRNYLVMQIPDRILKADDRKVLLYIIENIDDSGYFKGSAAFISEIFGVEHERVLWMLSLIQHMDPPGIGARNLQECLLLQLEALFPEKLLAKKIVRDHLELIAKNQLKVIANKTKHGINEVSDACALIKQLNPRPGSDYSTAQAAYVYPDVIIRESESGFKVILAEYNRSNIVINDQYHSMLGNCQEEEAKKYISDKYRQASLIKSCIRSRQETLLAVSRQIYEAQKLFFYKGPKYLLPLKQKDIADALELHESTICRAVRNKYLECSWGIFDMKYFFSNKLNPIDTGHDAGNAKEIIREIISGERKNRPYSDQGIADELARRGISISRRTVAKYREEAGIKNSVMRKQY